jgi:hypothetical protein
MAGANFWRVRWLQIGAAAILAACGGGGGGAGAGDGLAIPALSDLGSSTKVAHAAPCTINQLNLVVDAVRIRLAGANAVHVNLPQPRSIDLLDPGAGVLEALEVPPLTHDAVDLNLRVADGSTVRFDDGTVAALKVPGNLPLVGDFHLAAGMVADLVVQGFDRCGAVHAAGQSGQFVLIGDVPAMLRALPFVTDREQATGGSLRPVPGNGYATVSHAGAGSFTIQRFDAYGSPLGNATEGSLDGTAQAPSVNPPANGGVLATTPATGPLADGGFVVAWLAQGNVYAQRFGSDGSPQSAVAQINLTGTGPVSGTTAQRPSIVALPWGGFLIGWPTATEGNVMRFFDARGLLGD